MAFHTLSQRDISSVCLTERFISYGYPTCTVSDLDVLIWPRDDGTATVRAAVGGHQCCSSRTVPPQDIQRPDPHVRRQYCRRPTRHQAAMLSSQVLGMCYCRCILQRRAGSRNDRRQPSPGVAALPHRRPRAPTSGALNASNAAAVDRPQHHCLSVPDSAVVAWRSEPGDECSAQRFPKCLIWPSCVGGPGDVAVRAQQQGARVGVACAAGDGVDAVPPPIDFACEAGVFGEVEQEGPGGAPNAGYRRDHDRTRHHP